MDELDRESHAAGEHELASEVSERIRTIIASAEAAANAVRHEAEERAQVRRRVADEEARRMLEDARRDADALLAERRRRISELSDSIVERAEQIVMELDRAAAVRRQLQDLADSLGSTAERMARDLAAGRPLPPVEPTREAPVSGGYEPESAEKPEEADEPEAEADPEPAAEAPPAEDPPKVVELAEQRPSRRVEDQASERREPDERLNARLVALQMAVAGGSRSEVEVHLRRNFDVSDLNGILDDVFGDGDDPQKPVAGPPRSGGAA